MVGALNYYRKNMIKDKKIQEKRYKACSNQSSYSWMEAPIQGFHRNQIEAQRSGFDLERRSSGVSAL